MLERLGLGAILQFSAGKAIENMQAASKTLGKMQKGLKTAGKGARQVGHGVSRLGAAAVPAMIGVAGAAGGAVTKFAQFDDAMAVVRTIFPGTKEQFQGMRDAAQQMGVQFGTSSKQIAEGMYQALSASVPAGEATEFLGVAGKAAVGGLTDMRTSVDVLTTAVNTYGESLGKGLSYTQRTQKASDLLLRVQEKGKTTLGEMGMAMGFVLPVAQSLGVGLEDIGAAMATMTASGIRTSTAATSLRQVMATIARPSKQAEKAAKKLGIELGPVALQTKGLSGFMADLIDKTGGEASALVKIFGEVEAFNAAAKLAAGGGKAFTQALSEMQDVTGTTEKTFAARTDSLKFQAQQVFSALGVLAERAGQAIAEGFGLKGIGGLADVIMQRIPQITAWITSFVQGAREGFGRMAERLQTVKAALEPFLERLGMLGTGDTAQRIGSLAAQIGMIAVPAMGAFLAVKPLVGALSGVANILVGLPKMIMGVGGAFKAFLTASGPVKLILVLIAGVISAMIGDTTSLSGAFEGLKGVFEALKPLLDVVVGAFRILGEAVQWTGKALSWAFEQPLRKIERIRKATEDLLIMIDWINAELGRQKEARERKEKEARRAAKLEALGVGEAEGVQMGPKSTMQQSMEANIAKIRAEKRQREETKREKERKRCLEILNKTSVDGRELNVAESRARLEISERAGGGLTPWQRRQVVESGEFIARATG